jgi:Fe2+ transport system protein FeoA
MLFSRWRKRAQNRGFFGQRKGWKGKRNPTPHLLSELPPGSHAHIIGFQPFLSPERKTRLQAYGLTPGQEVLIIQQFPVTIVAIGHLELALENELAKLILTAT